MSSFVLSVAVIGDPTWDGKHVPEQYLSDLTLLGQQGLLHLDNGVVLVADCCLEGDQYKGLLVGAHGCAAQHRSAFGVLRYVMHLAAEAQEPPCLHSQATRSCPRGACAHQDWAGIGSGLGCATDC